MFVLVYINHGDNPKRFNPRKRYLPKCIIKNYNVIINGKNFYYQAINSDIKRYEEIIKLTTGQAEGYTTGCFLDYDYIKNYYRLIVVDFTRQKELDANPKAIQQIELMGQLKKIDAEDNATDTGNNQSMFVLAILEKIKETRLNFS